MSRTTRRKRPRFHKSTRGRVPDGAHQYVTAGCGHNNSCTVCSGNRTHANRRRAPLEDR